MGKNSKIEWCHHTFNPWLGCTPVSGACDHCYAEGWAKRTGHPELWQGQRRRTSEDNWKQPLKWDRAAAAAGERHRVFCASLADVFDNQAPDIWRSDLFALIEDTPSLDWLLLTKRPQNIAKMIWPKWDAGLPSNVWLGTTVENQEEADRRIPHLLAVPATVRFLSCEPLLGPVDLSGPLAVEHLNLLTGPHWTERTGEVPRLDWIIVGGESGSKDARPMHQDWARSLRDQCAAAGVPFFFKQHGEWLHESQVDRERRDYFEFEGLADNGFVRLGKTRAGRLLDGRTHDESPEVRHA